MTVHLSRDYRREDYVIARQMRNDGLRLQSSPAPLEPLWKSWAAGACIILFMYAAFVVAGIVGG